MAERGGTAVRERPILFSGEMVRALLEGRKTQTRRVVKLDTPEMADRFIVAADGSGDVKFCHRLSAGVEMAVSDWLRCPYGIVGDHLYVRETFSRCVCTQCNADWPTRSSHPISYQASYGGPSGIVWRPSIHMPRWASRITLEITDVRVERVQDISDSDVEEEGIEGSCYGFCVTERCWRGAFDDLSASDGYCPTCGGKDFLSEVPSDLYANLWDSLNAARGYSWERNPWVWVLSFRVVGAAGR